MRPSRRWDRGFSIIEGMVASIIMLVGLLGLASLQVVGVRSTHFGKKMALASQLARDDPVDRAAVERAPAARDEQVRAAGRGEDPGRHQARAALGEYGLDERRVSALPGHDDDAMLAPLTDERGGVEAETGLLTDGPMTGIAAGGEKRFDVAQIIDLGGPKGGDDEDGADGESLKLPPVTPIYPATRNVQTWDLLAAVRAIVRPWGTSGRRAGDRTTPWRWPAGPTGRSPPSSTSAARPRACTCGTSWPSWASPAGSTRPPSPTGMGWPTRRGRPAPDERRRPCAASPSSPACRCPRRRRRASAGSARCG